MPPIAVLTDNELAILGALAETLIPADDTPGADVEWARSFVVRHVDGRPEDLARFRALATHLDRLARAAHGSPFPQMSIPDREALLNAHHPSLADGAELAADERELRHGMRDLMIGFLSADGFDLLTDPYGLRPESRRADRAVPSGPDHAAADYLPDVVHDRLLATWVGTGTYARVWSAAGYPYLPGAVPPEPGDVGRDPDELITLRAARPAKR